MSKPLENSLKTQPANVQPLSDSEIIEKILNGEKEIYELIMRRYNQRMFRIARAIVKDEDIAEDVVQEAYIKAYEHLKDFKGNSAFSTWLTRILINESASKNNYKAKIIYLDPVPSEDNNSEYIITENSTTMRNPEQHAINNELRNHLERMIDSLPDKYRTVYIMREIENINTADTAECLNLSESNVKVRLNRAKEMLRENLMSVYEKVDVFQFLGERCDRIVNAVMKRLS
ncbi:MAG: RNA polymerase sigma factor [Ignavibacteriae bacterium]|nr:MAG: RNA polymerase sigma factor [Ignavibacteriota bacterium]